MGTAETREGGFAIFRNRFSMCTRGCGCRYTYLCTYSILILRVQCTRIKSLPFHDNFVLTLTAYAVNERRRFVREGKKKKKECVRIEVSSCEFSFFFFNLFSSVSLSRKKEIVGRENRSYRYYRKKFCSFFFFRMGNFKILKIESRVRSLYPIIAHLRGRYIIE